MLILFIVRLLLVFFFLLCQFFYVCSFFTSFSIKGCISTYWNKVFQMVVHLYSFQKNYCLWTKNLCFSHRKERKEKVCFWPMPLCDSVDLVKDAVEIPCFRFTYLSQTMRGEIWGRNETFSRQKLIPSSLRWRITRTHVWKHENC